MNLSDEKKQETADALKNGLKAGYEASKAKTGLTWWERALWVMLTGIAYAAASLLTGCGQIGELTPEQMQQIRVAGEQAHEAYHALTGKPCRFERGTIIYVPDVEETEK